VDLLPILVRAGSILPLQPDMDYIGETPVDPLTLDVFPSGRSRFDLYEDDGESLAYQDGTYAQTAITCDETARAIDLRVAAPAGHFVVSPRAYEFRVHLDAAPRAVRVEGGTWTYDAGGRLLLVRTDPARKSLTARVQIEK
jgi:alpha-glucosidase